MLWRAVVQYRYGVELVMRGSQGHGNWDLIDIFTPLECDRLTTCLWRFFLFLTAFGTLLAFPLSVSFSLALFSLALFSLALSLSRFLSVSLSLSLALSLSLSLLLAPLLALSLAHLSLALSLSHLSLSLMGISLALPSLSLLFSSSSSLVSLASLLSIFSSALSLSCSLSLSLSRSLWRVVGVCPTILSAPGHLCMRPVLGRGSHYAYYYRHHEGNNKQPAPPCSIFLSETHWKKSYKSLLQKSDLLGFFCP